MTLTLYTNPQSRGRIARWMLEEVGAPYETVVLGYADSMKWKRSALRRSSTLRFLANAYLSKPAYSTASE